MSKRSRNSGRKSIKLHLTTFRFVLIQKTLGKAPQARWKVQQPGDSQKSSFSAWPAATLLPLL